MTLAAVAEEWRRIPSLGGRYLASNLGRIKGPFGRALALKVHKNGYLMFGVANGKGGSRNAYVARSVCEAFHGPAPDGHQVDHIDRDRANDRPDNLRWVTKEENLARRQIAHGSTHAGARLTEEAVLHIRASSLTTAALAASLGVSPRTIRDARSGACWRRV